MTADESEIFKPSDWMQRGDCDAEGGRHGQYLEPRKDVRVGGWSLREGEEDNVVLSFQYDQQERFELVLRSGLIEKARYPREDGPYDMLEYSLLPI